MLDAFQNDFLSTAERPSMRKLTLFRPRVQVLEIRGGGPGHSAASLRRLSVHSSLHSSLLFPPSQALGVFRW